MKNHIFSIGLLAALAISCSIHEMDFKDANDVDEFYASIENTETPNTKVYATEELYLRWNADDRITIFNKYTYNQEYRFTGETGDNSGSFKKVDNGDFVTGNSLDNIYSIYPYLESTRISDTGVITVTLPAEQRYAENTMGLGANTMISATTDNQLLFKNVGGYLMLKLYGDDVTVSSITLKGNNGERIAGKATVSMPINGVPSVAMSETAGQEITLVCETPVKIGSTAETATVFWIVVPPTTFSNGFTLTVKDNKNRVFEKATSKSFEISRNRLARMSALEIDSTTPLSPSTLKDFAKEFVKGLDVWQTTIGTVESEGNHLIARGTAWENVHFIPIVPNPNCEYLGHEGNQYDPEYTPWVLNVAGQEISSSQAWEIAIRGLLNMVTAEGEAFLSTMDDRNKAYSLADNGSLNQAMPSASPGNQWGKHPWYEGSYDEMLKYNGNDISSVDVNFIVKVGTWHVVRSFIKVGSNTPIGSLGNFQTFGTSSQTLNLEGYDGNISSMRQLLIMMRIYKYLLDNNIDENVYSAIKDQQFDYDLYGIGIPSIPIPEAVDLGLSVKWASFNLGASKPEEYGDYFAWGETEPYYSSQDPLTWKDGKEEGYSWFLSYRWCMGSEYTMTKYCQRSDRGYNGFTDAKTVLDPEDDAAHVNLGGKWRMPTDAELDELMSNCTSTFATLNEVNGSLFTGSNGNSIFLPVAGYRSGTKLYAGSDDSIGIYRSSSLSTSYQVCAITMWFERDYLDGKTDAYSRYHGYSIRPVYAE